MENQRSKRGKTIFSFFKPSEQTSTSKRHSPSNIDVQIVMTNPLSNLRKLKLMLILLNEILGYEFHCGNILLINKMKLEELISKWVHINLS
jgi:hypothetical protein